MRPTQPLAQQIRSDRPTNITQEGFEPLGKSKHPAPTTPTRVLNPEQVLDALKLTLNFKNQDRNKT
jgi:hypothetical protein